MKIIADSAIPFLRGILEPYAEVQYLAGNKITADDVFNADALIIRTRTRCNQALLLGSSVRMIATATIGFDHIDRTWCSSHNIRVVTAAGCNSRGVLQWVAAVLRHLTLHLNKKPAELTLGVVGVGHVGTLVSQYAEAWGFRVLCCDPPREAREHGDFVSLETIAQRADIITFHTPLDSSTRHMADEAFFTQLKPNALIINSSRGEVVDSAALLQSGHPYVLDVWEHEPDLDAALLEHALLATPHIAGYTTQGKANATAMSLRALSNLFGFPLGDWYPAGIKPSSPQPITWSKMSTTIRKHFDIEAQSAALKAAPADFEAMRDNYRYREEFF
ncbi:MAG: 4-phosphoerythronate dehydrogenase [Alistipes sp.]